MEEDIYGSITYYFAPSSALFIHPTDVRCDPIAVVFDLDVQSQHLKTMPYYINILSSSINIKIYHLSLIPMF